MSPYWKGKPISLHGNRVSSSGSQSNNALMQHCKERNHKKILINFALNTGCCLKDGLRRFETICDVIAITFLCSLTLDFFLSSVLNCESFLKFFINLCLVEYFYFIQAEQFFLEARCCCFSSLSHIYKKHYPKC